VISLSLETKVTAHIQMKVHPEDYNWSSYRTILGLVDDKMTEKDKTLSYFGRNAVVFGPA
jgi:hypothetical protein